MVKNVRSPFDYDWLNPLPSSTGPPKRVSYLPRSTCKPVKSGTRSSTCPCTDEWRLTRSKAITMPCGNRLRPRQERAKAYMVYWTLELCLFFFSATQTRLPRAWMAFTIDLRVGRRSRAYLTVMVNKYRNPCAKRCQERSAAEASQRSPLDPLHGKSADHLLSYVEHRNVVVVVVCV